MNEEQIQSLIKQLKAAGLNDEEIMDTFYESFTSGEMDRNDLETLAEAMGYELTDDFKKDAQPDPIADSASEGDAGTMSKEQIEDAKEIKPGESAEEFKDKIGIDGDGNKNSEDDKKDDDDNGGSWDEAQKYFK